MINQDKKEIQEKIIEIENEMLSPFFWQDKNLAQKKIKELQEFKDQLSGLGGNDKLSAVMTIFAGAGGDDSEDFVAMLLKMYLAFSERRGWVVNLIHQNQNEQGGYRNVSFEILGKNVFYDLKYESGVHRLVRISPFNANAKRHTSFAMVEVMPILDDGGEFSLDEKDLQIEFSKSSGPGGQNVNKRETAVRVVHLPTNLAVAVESERSQERNREKAINLLTSKVFVLLEKNRKEKKDGLAISKSTANEWGSQIRSYVAHPYQMVKDHRTDVEKRNIDSVLKDGDIEDFLTAMHQFSSLDNSDNLEK